MPNKRLDISKKVAYDVKEASNSSLSKSAQKHYARNAQAGLNADNPMNMKGSHGPNAYGTPNHMDGKHHMKGQPHMESNKQEKYNLMHDNPVAKHGSFLSKHMKG